MGRFKRDVEEKELVGIRVPEVLHATPEVLVTQWIEGERARRHVLLGQGARALCL